MQFERSIPPCSFREAGDPRLEIADDQAVITETLEVRGQRLRVGTDDGAVAGFGGEMTVQDGRLRRCRAADRLPELTYVAHRRCTELPEIFATEL